MESFFWRKLLARSGFGKMLPSVQRLLHGGEQYLHWYSDRTLAVPLQQLQDPALLPNVQTPDSINLALGVPRCEAFHSLPRFVAEQAVLHPWGDPTLRLALSEQFHLNHGAEFDSHDEWFITHGGSGALATIIDAFVDPGDRVVLFDPSSPLFPLGLKHRRAEVQWVPTWSEDGFVRFKPADLMRYLRGAKMLLLADPVNPTGCVFAAEDMEQIAFWAKKNDVLVVQDVSFDPWRECPAPARLAALPHMAGRVLTYGSMAKSHGLNVVRVGWLAGARHLVAPCAAAGLLQAPFVAPLCQQVALHALQRHDVLPVRDELNRRRQYVRERLQDIGLQPWEAQAGFFFWFPVPQGESATAFAQRLLAHTGVLLNPGGPFSPQGAKYLRLSYAVEEGRLGAGLTRLADFMQQEMLGKSPATAPLAHEPR